MITKEKIQKLVAIVKEAKAKEENADSQLEKLNYELENLKDAKGLTKEN